MSLNSIYKLAIVLTKSQVRGTQRGKLLARLFANPRTILAIDAALMLGLGAAGYAITSAIPISALRESIHIAVQQGLTAIPTAIGFTVIVFGVLYEISQPVQSMSTDTVNWLPISPTEYVVGSIISESYLYSIMFSLFLGIMLGPAIYFNMSRTWSVTAIMSLVAVFIGSCVVEILDSVTNRISSSFYKRSGRTGIVFRLALTIIILVLVQLVFSGQMAAYLLRSLVQTVRSAWYIPVVWPSVAVLSFSEGNTLDSLGFGFGSLLFTFILLSVAAGFRARFWVPVPVSIKLTPQIHHHGTTTIPGLGSVESAIIRKDFRSLTRRREMARFLAIPFVLAVSMGFSFFSISNPSSPDLYNLVFVLFLCIIPITIFAEMLGMTCMGQEASAVWNIYAAPITPKRLLRAKLLYTIFLSVPFSVVIGTLFAIIMTGLTPYLWVLILLGVILSLEQSALGITIGARFPDFRETIRSRYVSVTGSLIGIFLGLMIAGLTMSPIFASVFFLEKLSGQVELLAFVLGIATFLLILRIAEREFTALLRNIRI